MKWKSASKEWLDASKKGRKTPPYLEPFQTSVIEPLVKVVNG